MQLVDSMVPKPSKEASFHWAVCLVDGFISGTVYTDGSQLDGPTPLLRRCGWVFVAIDEDGEIIASAYGVPPEWIYNIAGSEAWALHEASSRALPGTVFKVDCKPCVDMVKAGLSVAGQGKRMLARIYRLIFTSIDEHSAENVVWMSAHTSEDEVGKSRLGDVTLLSATDRFGNAEADKLAKKGVEAHRVPRQVRDAVHRQADLQYELAKWLGQVTAVAG